MAITVDTLSEALEYYSNRYQNALANYSKREIESFLSTTNQINTYYDIVSAAVSENNFDRAQDALDEIVALLNIQGITISSTVFLPVASAVYASPGVIQVPVDNLGLNPDFTNTKSTVYIYQGGVDVSDEYTIIGSSAYNVTVSVTDNEVSIIGITADEGWVKIKCSKTGFGDLYLTIYVYKYYDPDNGLTLDTYPESILIPVDIFGNNADVSNAISTVVIRQGSVDETSEWTFAIDSVTDVTAVIQNDNEVKINSITADEGSVTVECTRSGYSALYIDVRAYKFYEHERGLAIDTYPSTILVPADSDGSNPVFTNALSVVIVRYGSFDDTANWTFTVQAVTNVTAAIQNDNEVKISAMTADEGSVTVRITRTGYTTHDIDIPVQKQMKGQAVVDGSSVDDISIGLNSSSEIYLKRDSGSVDAVFGDNSDIVSWYNKEYTGPSYDPDEYILKSSVFRRATVKYAVETGGPDWLYTFTSPDSYIPYEAQGNLILGTGNFLDVYEDDGYVVDNGYTNSSSGTVGTVVFSVGQGDLTSYYVVSSRILVFVEYNNPDSDGIRNIMTGTITSSTYTTYTTVTFDCDYVWTQGFTDYLAAEEVAGNDIHALVYSPYVDTVGAIGSHNNIIFGGYNFINGESNKVFGSSNSLNSAQSNSIYGSGWKVVPTSTSYLGVRGNLLIGTGPSWGSATANEIKGHGNLIISRFGNTVCDHEDCHFNIIIGGYGGAGEYATPQSYGAETALVVGIKSHALASYSNVFGFGGRTTTPGEIAFSGSDSDVQKSIWILEGTTSSTSPTILYTLTRSATSTSQAYASSIQIENNKAFSGVLDIVGVRSTGTLNRKRYPLHFSVDGSGVVSVDYPTVYAPLNPAVSVGEYDISDWTDPSISLLIATANELQVQITAPSTADVNWVCLVEGIIQDLP